MSSIVSVFLLALSFQLSKAATTTRVNFITRKEWGAEPPRVPPVKLPATPNYTLVHHTDTQSCSNRSTCDRLIRSIDHYHRDVRGWNDIGYHFLIVPSGDVYIGRGWGIVGAHAGVTFFNEHSIGISFVGNYSQAPPPPNMWTVFNALVDIGTSTKQLTTPFVLKGHRDVRDTTCPGVYLYGIVTADPRYQPGPRSNPVLPQLSIETAKSEVFDQPLGFPSNDLL